jgi:hypothetical protein
MPIAELLATISGLKTVMDTLKGFKDIGDANVRNSVAVELQQKILAAYQAQMALAEEVGSLEKEVAAFKNWDAEKAKYELKDIGQGCVAYALKEGVQPAEPPHYLCANCYAQNKKRFLQIEHKAVGRAVTYCCHDCGSVLYTHGHHYPEHDGKRRS